MAFTGTPAAEYVEGIVLAQFGHLVSGVGQYNRRKISGTDIWSQHSWGNANDFHVDDLMSGDLVYDFLNTNRTALGIRVLLWRVPSHFDHLHADYWPKGIGTPPLSPALKGSFLYSDGRQVRDYIRKVPKEASGVEVENVLKRGDSGNAVKYYQTAINKGGFGPVTVDGAFGPATEQAVMGYQNAADITQSGVIDGVTAFLLGRYNLPSGTVDTDARTQANRANNRLDNVVVPK